MAPVGETTALVGRQSCQDGYYYSSGYCYSNSSWYWWGRWVFTAVVIIAILIIFFMLACVNNRRRRRQGLQPMWGTGWVPMAGGGKYYGPQYNNPNAYNGPPPQYNQGGAVPGQYTGNTFNSNDGFYGRPQTEGIQLQPPSNAYYPRAADGGYEPPAGPPPSKVA